MRTTKRAKKRKPSRGDGKTGKKRMGERGRENQYYNIAHAAMAIAGDEASTRFDGAGVTSPSPELLFSLGTALLPLTVSVPGANPALVSLSPLSRAATLPSPFSGLAILWLRQVGSCQPTPVKLLRRRGCFSHFRHGAPERSNARRPALMAPVFAFGPSRWAAGTLPASPPSSLYLCQFPLRT